MSIPVAAMDLPADHVIGPGDIILTTLTQKQMNEKFKALAGETILPKVDAIVNRRLSKPVRRGQPFPANSFYLSGTGPNIVNKLQPGFRAVRVEVPNGHDGGVQPGSFTDVLFRSKAIRATRDGQPAIPETTKTLLRDIEVLQVERPMKPAALGKRPEPIGKTTTVTLAVPDTKADIFGVIAGRGEVWLEPTPKDRSDIGVSGAKSLTLADLLGIKPPVKTPAPPPPFETAIYLGGRLHQVNKFIDGKLLPTSYRAPKQRETPPPAVPAAEQIPTSMDDSETPAGVSDATAVVPTFSQDN